RSSDLRAVVVDPAGELALPRAGLPGEQDVDVERRDQRGLLERGREGDAAADDVRRPEAATNQRGMVGDGTLAVARQHAIGERGAGPGERLGAWPARVG